MLSKPVQACSKLVNRSGVDGHNEDVDVFPTLASKMDSFEGIEYHIENETYVFTPTEDQFRDIGDLYRVLPEMLHVSNGGMVKIVPANKKAWIVQPEDLFRGDLKVKPRRQVYCAQKAKIFHLGFNTSKKNVSCATYYARAMAKGSLAGRKEKNVVVLNAKFEDHVSRRRKTGYGMDVEVQEEVRDVERDNPQGIPGTRNLHHIPGCLLRRYLGDTSVPKIAGVSTPYLYIGEKGSAFPMHTEDRELNAISILRHGDGKVWSGPIPEDRELFEK